MGFVTISNTVDVPKPFSLTLPTERSAFLWKDGKLMDLLVKRGHYGT